MKHCSRFFLIIIIWTLIIAALGACATPTAEPTSAPTPTKVPDKVRVLLPWFHTPGFSYIYAAEELGYYEEASLDVEVLSGEEIPSPFQLLAAGEVDILLTNPNETISARLQGVPVKFIAATMQESALVFLSMTSSNIGGLEDTSGTLVGIRPGDDSEMVFRGLVEMNLTEEEAQSIQYVPIGFDTTPLVAGTIDIFPGWETSHPWILRNEGFDVSYFTATDYGFHAHAQGFATLDSTITERHDVVRRFIQATMRGMMDYINPAMKEQLIGLAHSRIPDFLMGDPLESDIFDSYLPYRTSQWTQENGLGWINPDYMSNAQDLLFMGGIIEETRPVDEYFTNEFIEEVNRNGQLIWPPE